MGSILNAVYRLDASAGRVVLPVELRRDILEVARVQGETPDAVLLFTRAGSSSLRVENDGSNAVTSLLRTDDPLVSPSLYDTPSVPVFRDPGPSISLCDYGTLHTPKMLLLSPLHIFTGMQFRIILRRRGKLGMFLEVLGVERQLH